MVSMQGENMVDVGLWTVWLHRCVEAKCGSVDQSAVKKYNCDVMTVLIYQHNMDCIKTEPDPDAEVHSPSCIVIHLVDIKQEEQPLAISFPPAKDGNDVSCQCAVANGM